MRLSRHPSTARSRAAARLGGSVSPRLSLRRQDGITAVESIIAIVLFAIVATALAHVLVSSINAKGISRERTSAQQAAMAQIEKIRRLEYDDVGTVAGNPPGVLATTESITDSGVALTVQTQVSYVGDQVPTGYATGANYKRVTITVLRASDSKQLAQETTYVAPPARAPYGGLNNAIVNVQVVDYGNSTPVQGANVNLTLGPSAPRNDATDITGSVTFAALDPNPSAASFYDIAVSKAGFVTLNDDLSPASAAHVSLAPSQTFNTAIRIYRPATIQVKLTDAYGGDWASTAAVTISSSRGSETFPLTGADLTVTSINGEPVVPSIQYTVSATSGYLATPALTEYVPDDYPADLDSLFTLAFPAAGSLEVTVLQLTAPAAGATVTLDGGPNAISLSGTTDANGLVTFVDVPAGTGYTVTAVKGAESNFEADVEVPDGATGTGTVTVTLPDPPPPGTLVANVTWAGLNVSGASVTLSGGPASINVTGTTDASGGVTFVNVPAGSGYTVTAVASGQSAAQSASVSAGGTTNVSLALPTGTMTVTVRKNGNAQVGATVQLTGGPMSISLSGTTNGSGQVTFVNLPAGSGYSLVAFKCTVSGNDTGTAAATVSAGSNSVTVNFTSNTC